MNKNLLFILTLFFFSSFLFHFSVCLGLLIHIPLPPSGLTQFKSDNETLIQESSITTEDTVVFKVVNSEDNAKIEIEVRQITEPFTGIDDGGIIESDFVPFDSVVFITRHGLINGQYHWRARAVDIYDDASDWREFGETESFDFEVRLVPLYTQVLSTYPSIADTAVSLLPVVDVPLLQW